MSEELVVEQCSPTMAGLKTGSLFSCPAEDTRTLWQSIRRLNQRLVPCGIRLVPVKIFFDNNNPLRQGSKTQNLFLCQYL